MGSDNRLTIVVGGGLSLAVAAALCAFVTEAKAEPAAAGVDAAGLIEHPTARSA